MFFDYEKYMDSLLFLYLVFWIYISYKFHTSFKVYCENNNLSYKWPNDASLSFVRYCKNDLFVKNKLIKYLHWGLFCLIVLLKIMTLFDLE